MTLLLVVFLAACSGGGGGSTVPNSPNENLQGGQGAQATTVPILHAGGTSSPATPGPTATPDPTATPAERATSHPTATPAATATPHATASPTAQPAVSGSPGPYDPPAGTFPNFPSSVFLQKLPQNPSVNANSSQWLSRLGTISLEQLQFADGSGGIAQDYSYPVYKSATGPTALAVKVHCTEPWGTCSVEGKTVYVDSRATPENGGNIGDAHFAIVDSGTGMEYDFWRTQWPPKNGVLTIGWGGECPLSGNGIIGCGATATSTAISLGIIRAKDLVAAVQNGGTLPYALQTAIKCTNTAVAPFLTSDGSTPGCPPEGARVYLAMHDSDVNASGVSGILQAILRTIDEDHYGMFVTDTNGGEDGFSLTMESDLTYTTFGLPGPAVTDLVPLAQSEGVPGSSQPFQSEYYLQLPLNGLDLASKLKFL